MKPQLTGDRWTGAPPLIWSACSWCPDGRSWHQPGLAGHRTGPDSVESTAETGRHPGGVLGASGETHPDVAVSGGCRAPKHDGVCVCDAPRTPTANKAQRWWRCQPCFSKRKMAGGGEFWAVSSTRVCVRAYLTIFDTKWSSNILAALRAYMVREVRAWCVRGLKSSIF